MHENELAARAGRRAWLWRGWRRVTPAVTRWALPAPRDPALALTPRRDPVIVTPSLRVHALALGVSNAYLLETAQGVILVDTGLPLSEEMILARLATLGRADLRLIFITHAHVDHYGSAAALRRQTGAAIAVHRADAEDMAAGRTRLGTIRAWGWTQPTLPRLEPLLRVEPAKADLVLEEGKLPGALRLDAQVVHLPGHTSGSCALLVEGQYAFIGDLISTVGPVHVQRSYAQDWPQVAASVEKLRGCRPVQLFPGHGHTCITAAMLDALTLDGPAAHAGAAR
jgi:glyoxylase-like metal-dependent hydrolase (beta-lactamase superfamily II)